MIKDHHYSDYNFDQMPSTICMGCDRILRFIDKADQETRKEDAKRKLVPINYEDKKSPPPSVTTRAAASVKCDCFCFWCRVARLSGPEYLIHANSVRQPPKKSSPPKPRHVTRCERCHAVIGKGKRHQCTKTTRNKNQKAMVKACSTEGQKRHTSSLLNSFCEEEGIDRQSGTLLLNSGSKFKTINMGKKKPEAQMKVADLIKFGNENSKSDRDILKTATFVRRVFGKNSVEKDLEKTLPEAKKDLVDYVKLFEVQTVRKRKGKPTIVATVPLVSIDDFKGFCLKAMEERGLNPQETDIQIGCDDGGGEIKVNVL